MTELKTGWQLVMFGEMAECINDRVDNPAESGVDRYVGLEHLDSESLKIRRWGSPDDVESTKLRFRPGDIIFGKRRAYQRKLAVADFEGICSAHAMVLRAKPAVALPEFLPFLMQSDFFMERAVEISVGSLSPTINWKTLACQEFALPPLEEQRRMATLISTAQAVTECQADAHSALSAVVQAGYIKDILGMRDSEWIAGRLEESSFPEGWSLVPAEAICIDTITKGATPTGQLTREETGIPFYKVYNLTFSGTLDFSVDPTWISASGHHELRRSSVRSGDVLMNIVGPPLGKVSRVPQEMPEGNINQAIARFRTSSDSLSTWLEAYLLSPIAQAWLSRRSKKTSGQQNLTLETCRELPVPIPPDIEDRLALLQKLSGAYAKATHRLKEARDCASMISERTLSINRIDHE
jgi:type I restriction enzyme S subunit